MTIRSLVRTVVIVLALMLCFLSGVELGNRLVPIQCPPACGSMGSGIGAGGGE